MWSEGYDHLTPSLSSCHFTPCATPVWVELPGDPSKHLMLPVMTLHLLSDFCLEWHSLFNLYSYLSFLKIIY